MKQFVNNISVDFLDGRNIESIVVINIDCDDQSIVDKISYFYPDIRIKDSNDAFSQNDLLLILAAKPQFEIESLSNILSSALYNEVVLILPLGYPALLVYSDFDPELVNSSYEDLSTVIELCSKMFNYIDVSVNTSVLAHYCSFTDGEKTNSSLQIFKDIIGCKNKYYNVSKVPGDLPCYLNFVLSNKSISNANTSKLLPTFRNIDNLSKIQIFSVFDRVIGHEKHFKLINPLFVNDKCGSEFLSVDASTNFFEQNNPRVSELTAIHYALKKLVNSDIVGFCHYRRFINIGADSNASDQTHTFDNLKNILGLIEDTSKIISHFDTADIILANVIELGNTQHTHYCLSHYSEDYYVLINEVLNNHSFLKSALLESIDSHSLIGSNLIIGKRELVEYIFDIVFDVLSVYKNHDNFGRTKYQKRDVAFLSERIFDTVVRYLINQGIRVKFLPRIHLTY